MIVKILNLRNIFQFPLDDIGVSTYCKRVVATTFLALLALKISLLVVLILFISLALVGRRLLVLTTRYVSKKSVSELSSFRVFLLFFCKFIPLETPGINFPGPYRWL